MINLYNSDLDQNKKENVDYLQGYVIGQDLVISKLNKQIEELDRWDNKLISERDYWEEKATELATDIATYFGVDFGEHTSHNCPVQNALDYVYGMIKEKEDKEWINGQPIGKELL